LLDWEERLFTEIGKEFISELTKEYGTDNLYAIDQFIEMNPEIGDTSYLKNMSKTVMSSVTEADPKGKWVLQTWPFNFHSNFWTPERTKAYFDGVPDDRMIALELQGEAWSSTGWYKHDSWYGKPWVWSVLSNFGDKVEMFGGLTQITENFEKVLSSPEKGNLSGLGLMNEGLGYNPVVYDFVTDMVWETGVPDLDTWKEQYLKSRYGIINEDIINSWEYIFNYFYTKSHHFQGNKIISRPYLVEKDIWPSEPSVLGAESLIGIEDKLKNIDTYQYDIVNLFRDIFGQYAGHLLFEVTSNYENKDIEKFNESVKEFNDLSEELEQLIATREEFLFGKWIADSRERATNAEEELLYEWNAKAIITNWGGEYARGLNSYAKKDWAGLYSSYHLRRWNKLFDLMKSEIAGGEKLDMDRFNKDITVWEDNWNNLREENISSVPTGNSIVLAKELWGKYGNKILNH
jgi:alpha-N-acetylglucosaminidase